jgi:hypothetical protein
VLLVLVRTELRKGFRGDRGVRLLRIELDDLPKPNGCGSIAAA